MISPASRRRQPGSTAHSGFGERAYLYTIPEACQGAAWEYRPPNTVAFVERFIQTLKHECLDYFIVFGQQHMDYFVSEMVTYYHEERPHQSKDNDPLIPAVPDGVPKKRKPKKCKSPPEAVLLSQIRCRKRLGGLLKHYSRKAA